MKATIILSILVALVFTESSHVVPNNLGVNIHFTSPLDGEMDLLAATGWKHVRMDFTWSDIETHKAVYDFAQYDVLMNNLKRHQMSAIFILAIIFYSFLTNFK